jgi:Arc/MetJ-type ribon-helix-helix transcriptional regulator
MSADLSNDNDAYINDAIARGAFRDRNEALDAGVDMLRRRAQLLARIDEGRRQLDDGEYVEFDEAGLRQFFEQLKDRARSAAKGASHE